MQKTTAEHVESRTIHDFAIDPDHEQRTECAQTPNPIVASDPAMHKHLTWTTHQGLA